MWTRGELKSRAKACLRKYYWMAFLVSLLASLLGGGLWGSMGAGSSASTANTQNGSGGDAAAQIGQDAEHLIQGSDMGLMLAVLAVSMVAIVIAFGIATLWGTFMGNVVAVGSCRYFMESRAVGKSAGAGRLFWCFGQGRYLNVVKVMFLKNLFVFLWTLLLIVPGLIKSYQYAMVPYILSENPNMNYRDALDLSRQMMDGEKFNLFILQLSFIGWELLGVLLCGIGKFFVNPYENATFAEFYAVLRKRPNTGGAMLPGYGETPEPVYAEYTTL